MGISVCVGDDSFIAVIAKLITLYIAGHDVDRHVEYKKSLEIAKLHSIQCVLL